ncbi:hypothetical protein HBH64_117300 [Parastagonospora nodorum]|nr:hypothetical protein HBH51_023410 [Parastagonospora nodorum]KAH4310986.1 hypothetical protein HBI02_098910 [Parastagonospora nodorum]KAH4496347.1 hypothetical protein HBH88_092250 [Parastagonospora nodorum]KAH4587310.1 hypothetical protein HBH83_136400 [Parastagonospora nodorum]KAH4677380.1 hypothetical protein HBH80_056370 [Parastagonospora nodorum]
MAVICRQLTFIPNKSGGASPNLSILGSKNTLLPHFSQNLYAAVARYDFPLGEWGREKDRVLNSFAMAACCIRLAIIWIECREGRL